jgi:PAS domain S-box-containing protein
LDLVQESVILCDRDGRIERWNKTSEWIYGWSRAEVEGRALADVLGAYPGPVRERVTSPNQAEAFRADLHRTTSSGNGVVVAAQLSVRHDSSGAIRGWVETGVDVTALRQQESAATAARDHYRNVFRAIPASIWDIDFSQGRRLALSWLESVTVSPQEWFAERPEKVRELMRATYCRDVNDQAIALFGPCARDDLLVDIERYWPDSSLPDFVDWVASALAGETYFSRETRQCRYGGDEFDALFTACFAPGTVETGRLVVSIVDHSQIKRDQAAARESEAFYTNMFHGSAFSAWHQDARQAWAIYRDLYARGITDFRAHMAQNPDFIPSLMDGIRVVDVNDTTLTLFGARDRSDIIGGSIEPFWFPDRMEPLIGSLEAAFNGIPAYRSLARMRTLEGKEIDVLFTRSASTDLSNAGQVLLAIVDMTDKVKAQKALAEMQANFAHAARISSLGELTASIAHEVNQPLAAIAANGEATLRWLKRPSPDLEILRGITADMIADARRASEVVANIRSMASPQTSPRRSLSLTVLVHDALVLLASQMETYGALALCDLATDLPEIQGDAVQLQQVIVNLVQNALHALDGKPGSSLRVSTARDDDHLVLRVEDNGAGIPEECLPQLFRSFFTTKPAGMGMGLAICRTIVEAHGGAISAENMSVGGARFTVRLPVVAA